MRQGEVKTPHFKLPFQFGGIQGGAMCNEQDESADVIDCIKTIMIFPLGFRDDLPDFGTPDLVFKMVSAAPIVDRIDAILKDWEPRSVTLTSEDRSELDNFVRHFLIQSRGQEV